MWRKTKGEEKESKIICGRATLKGKLCENFYLKARLKEIGERKEEVDRRVEKDMQMLVAMLYAVEPYCSLHLLHDDVAAQTLLLHLALL